MEKLILSENKLTIDFKNSKPVELKEFSNSLESVANEYYKFIGEREDFNLNNDTKIYVSKIREGSIVTELTDMAQSVIPFVEFPVAIYEFAEFLRKGFAYFLNNAKEKPKEFDLKDCNNFENIIKPVANDSKSSIIFQGNVEFKDKVEFHINSVDANAIQNGIRREKESLKEPFSNNHNNVLFYWDSAKHIEGSNSIDKGYIDSISLLPLKVTFGDDIDKKELLDIDKNPFHYAFLVDVEVLEIKSEPKVYKILRLHEILDK